MAKDRGISIIIPVWNQLGYTRLSVQSIIDNAGVTPFELIVVDNGSGPEVRDYFDAIGRKIQVRYIRNEENLGPIKAINQGIAVARFSHIMAIHNDVVICEDGWLGKIVSAMEADHGIGLVGLAGRQEIYKGGNVNEASLKHNLQNEEGLCPRMEEEMADVAVVDGLCFVMSESLLRSVRSLDETYGYMHCYDFDISLKSIANGFRNVVVKIEAMHIGNGGRTRLTKGYRELVKSDSDLLKKNYRIFSERWKDLLPMRVGGPIADKPKVAQGLTGRLRLRIEKVKFLIWARGQGRRYPCPEALKIWKKLFELSEGVETQALLGGLPHILEKDRRERWWSFRNHYPFIYALARSLAPGSYLEIGSRYGYSLATIYLGAKESLKQVTSIDLQEYEKGSQDYAMKNLLGAGYKGGYEFFAGSSHDPEIKKKVRGRLYGLVNVDGDHSYEGALEDILFYWNNVKPGGFMIVDDVLWQVFSNGKRVLRAVKDGLPALEDVDFYEFIGAGVRTKHKPERGIELKDFVDRRTGLLAFYRGLVLIKKREA